MGVAADMARVRFVEAFDWWQPRTDGGTPRWLVSYPPGEFTVPRACAIAAIDKGAALALEPPRSPSAAPDSRADTGAADPEPAAAGVDDVAGELTADTSAEAPETGQTEKEP